MDSLNRSLNGYFDDNLIIDLDHVLSGDFAGDYNLWITVASGEAPNSELFKLSLNAKFADKKFNADAKFTFY